MKTIYFLLQTWYQTWTDRFLVDFEDYYLILVCIFRFQQAMQTHHKSMQIQYVIYYDQLQTHTKHSFVYPFSIIFVAMPFGFGPATWKECMSWPERGMQSIREIILSKTTGSLKSPKVIVTSSFSGVGTAEICGKLALNAFRKDMELPPEYICSYSCADINKHCRSLLLQQDIQHVFGSTTECFDQAVVDKLRDAIQQEKVKLAQGGHGPKSDAWKAAGKRICRFAKDLFADKQPLKSAWCYRCKSFCKRFPDQDLLHSQDFHRLCSCLGYFESQCKTMN